MVPLALFLYAVLIGDDCARFDCNAAPSFLRLSTTKTLKTGRVGNCVAPTTFVILVASGHVTSRLAYYTDAVISITFG